MAKELEKGRNLEYSTRLILTPFPIRDVRGMNEYTKEFQDGKNSYSMTLKTMAPAHEIEERNGRSMIPTAEIGRNIHAMLMGDLRRKMLEGDQAEARILWYPSFAHVAERIQCRYNPKNVEKMADIFYRLAWMSLSYVQNGRSVVPGPGLLGRPNSLQVGEAKRFAARYSREETARGKPVSFAIEISPEYVEMMGTRMTTVKEDVYMGLESSFAKDFYVWCVYGSRWAAANKKPFFEATPERLVRQFTEQRLTRNNSTYFHTQIARWLAEIKAKDPLVDGVFENGKVTILPRAPLSIEKDRGDSNATAVPTMAGPEVDTAEEGEKVSQLEIMAEQMRHGVSGEALRQIHKGFKDKEKKVIDGELDFS